MFSGGGVSRSGGCLLFRFKVEGDPIVEQIDVRQAALDERDAENRALREDNAQLKGQLRDVRYQNESLEAALAEDEMAAREAGDIGPELAD